MNSLNISSTSYDRYYEGRKDFGSMITHVRSFTIFKIEKYTIMSC